MQLTTFSSVLLLLSSSFLPAMAAPSPFPEDYDIGPPIRVVNITIDDLDLASLSSLTDLTDLAARAPLPGGNIRGFWRALATDDTFRCQGSPQVQWLNPSRDVCYQFVRSNGQLQEFQSASAVASNGSCRYRIFQGAGCTGFSSADQFMGSCARIGIATFVAIRVFNPPGGNCPA